MSLTGCLWLQVSRLKEHGFLYLTTMDFVLKLMICICRLAADESIRTGRTVDLV